MRTLLILLKKEFLLFRRNKFIPKIALIFPCMVILIIPLVANMEIKHLGVAIVNYDDSRIARNIIADMDASPLFNVYHSRNYDEAMNLIHEGKADVILEIPADFQKSIINGEPSKPHISANGVNGIKGTLGSRYVVSSMMNSISSTLGVIPQETVTVNYFYNATLEYRSYMIPALMIMLLIMLSGFLPALNLVGEKESGTIEQINVTPVKTHIFVLSKVIPYWILGIIVITLAMVIAAMVYDLSPIGSLGSIYLATLLFVFTMSGIGIIIANFSGTMSQSMFLMLFVVLIFVLMSGLLTPISSMPDWAQMITYFLPPRYYIEIMRCVYLKGTSMTVLLSSYLILGCFAVIFNTIAALTYKKQK